MRHSALRHLRTRRDDSRRHEAWGAATLLIGVALLPPAAFAQATIEGLGFLPGGTLSRAFEVSADGAVVVGYAGLQSGWEAFRWTEATGMVGLGDFASSSVTSTARGVSADGTFVVGDGSLSLSGDFFHQAFRWTAASGIIGLGGFVPECPESVASAVSADGSVVATTGYKNLQPEPGCSGAARAARWTATGGFMELDPSLDLLSFSNDVSADGTTIVGTLLGATEQAFRWTPSGGMQGLGFLPGDGLSSSAAAVSSDGSVVVGEARVPAAPFVYPRAFRWTAVDGMTDLDPLGAFDRASATDVSADGSVVVGLADNGSFVWDAENGMRDLSAVLVQAGANLSGWTLSVFAVSADGLTFVGDGRSPAGLQEAWRAIIAPPACRDGADNDGDGLVDHPDDPGCAGPNGATEDPDCGNGVDDDGDGFVDLEDPGCASTTDASERASDHACDDGADDDGDGFVDLDDPGCDGVADESEKTDAYECDNAADDDGDDLVDFPSDPGCTAPDDVLELGACQNGEDDDADGLADLDDPGCDFATDGSERSAALACDDGVDNDGDGAVDYPSDPGCPLPLASPEDPACDNGIDDDADGDVDAADASCTPEWPYWETTPCGVGAELVLVLPVVTWLRARRRRVN